MLTKRGRIFLFLLLSLFFIYSPVWMIDYAHHDDYQFFLKTHGQWQGHSFNQANIKTGRSVNALFQTIFGCFVNSLEDLKKIRGITIFIFSLTGFLCLLSAEKLKIRALPSFLLVVMVLTLPAFEVIISYAGIAQNAFGILFSTAAALIIWHTFNSDRLRSHLTLGGALLAFILLLLGMNTYPSTATFYWVIVAGMILLSPVTLKEMQIKISGVIIIGLGTMIVYALLLKFTQNFSEAQISGIYNPYVVTHKYLEKFSWFVQEPLQNALNLWNVFPQSRVAWMVGGWIFSGVAIAVIRLLRAGERAQQVLKWVMIYSVLFGSLLLLSFLPNLIAVGDAPFYRCLAGPMTLALMAVCWSVYQWLSLISPSLRSRGMIIFLVAGCVFGSYHAYRHVWVLRALPSRAEFAYVSKGIEEAIRLNSQRIHILRPDQDQIKHRYDEFGHLTTMDITNMLPLFTAALRETVMQEGWIFQGMEISDDQLTTSFLFTDISSKTHQTRWNFIISTNMEGVPPPRGQQVYILDMNALFASTYPLTD
jgi:hypothetical protein